MQKIKLYLVVGCVMGLLVLVATIAKVEADDFEEELRSEAERGDAMMQFMLGIMYADGGFLGRRWPQDDIRAVFWLRHAAEQDHAEAQYRLGKMYAAGRGVLQDHAEAEKWFRKAAEQGLCRGASRTGSHVRERHGCARGRCAGQPVVSHGCGRR